METKRADTMPRNFPDDVVLAAIKDSGGNISEVARRLGTSWITASKYMKSNRVIEEAFVSEREMILDIAEAELVNLIKGKDIQAIKFMLATIGKRRGYTERMELTGADGSGLIPNRIEVVLIDGPESKTE